MFIGAACYPEHVSAETWERDAALMERADFNVTRLAEFAWVFMEPEDEFDCGGRSNGYDWCGAERPIVNLVAPTASLRADMPAETPQLTVEMNRSAPSDTGILTRIAAIRAEGVIRPALLASKPVGDSESKVLW